MTSNRKNTPHIVVVGPCASGKSTLVALLRSRGYDAVVCGQEHSEIANLWQRTKPDALIALTVDLDTIRARRGADWPVSIYEVQLARLDNAFASATVTINTSDNSVDFTLETVLLCLRNLAEA